MTIRKSIFSSPAFLGSMLLAVVGVVLGQWPLAAIGVIAAVGSIAYLSMKESQSGNAGVSLDSVSNENRVRIAPIKRLHREISELVATNANNAAVHVIGAEAVKEADQIFGQAVRMLQIRADLSKLIRSRSESESERAELEEKLISARAEDAISLQSALEARKQESEHYASAQVGIDRIDGGLRQAEAALSELKARLTVSSMKSKDLESQDESLSDTIGRLRVLGSSLEEAEAALRVGTE